MTEPDVTLTDYGLVLECAVLTWLLRRRAPARLPLRPWVLLFFGSVGLAALLGGTVHGFFSDPASTGQRLLWPATLLAIGVTALSAWAMGAGIALPRRGARRLQIAALFEFIGYAGVVLFVSQSFAVAVINYLPAALFLLVAFGLAYGRQRAPQALAGLAGLALTLAASGMQQAGIALHPAYFNHNALYHLIEAGGLLMIFRGARWLIETEGRTAGPVQPGGERA